LETEAGARLISRDGRGVTLTQAGRALVARAETIAAELNAAEAELAALARRAAGQVRLAALPSSNATLVPEALASLAARGRKLTVSLVEAGPEEAFALLERAECDLAVTFDHPALPAPPNGLVTVPLLDDRLFVILPATHPLAGSEDIELTRLPPNRGSSANAAGPRRCTPARWPGSPQGLRWSPTTTMRSRDWSPPGLASA
jgi:DNA-binding transcriptional LysR family regulator